MIIFLPVLALGVVCAGVSELADYAQAHHWRGVSVSVAQPWPPRNAPCIGRVEVCGPEVRP